MGSPGRVRPLTARAMIAAVDTRIDNILPADRMTP